LDSAMRWAQIYMSLTKLSDPTSLVSFTWWAQIQISLVSCQTQYPYV
jgi:hypothetical protein